MIFYYSEPLFSLFFIISEVGFLSTTERHISLVPFSGVKERGVVLKTLFVELRSGRFNIFYTTKSV